MQLCTDTDLLIQDPSVFTRAGLAAQTLLSGTGDLAGTMFTLDTGVTSLGTARIQAGQVLSLSGAVSGAFPIVSVESTTQLTVSATHADLFPLVASPPAVPIGSANDLAFVVRTFAPQIAIVSDMILRAAGLDDEDQIIATVLNPIAVARLVATGTLAQVYLALASVSVTPVELLASATRCEGFFRKSFEGFRIRIDTDGDGVADIVKRLGAIELVRV